MSVNPTGKRIPDPPTYTPSDYTLVNRRELNAHKRDTDQRMRAIARCQTQLAAAVFALAAIVAFIAGYTFGGWPL